MTPYNGTHTLPPYLVIFMPAWLSQTYVSIQKQTP